MRGERTRASFLLLLVLLYALLAAGYFVLRYQGRWSDSDTGNLTAAIAAVIEEGSLTPGQDIYSMGYAYQTFVAFLARAADIPLVWLQYWVLPLVAALLGALALVAYRELTGDAVAAALAALLLFLQPTFLFVIFRGSHEKITWLATLLALYALARSFNAAGALRSAAIWVGAFYLAVFTLISSNAFFASSFIAAVGFSLVAGFLLMLLAKGRGARGPEQAAILRLMYVLASTMVIWVIVSFYLYQPASRILLEMSLGVDRTAAVALGAQPKFDPYASVAQGWISPTAYLGLTMPSWIVTALSFLVWAAAGLRWLFRGQRPATPGQLLLWLLYGGFGLQLAAAVALDQAAAISGNLQLRMFPAVTVMALPLVAAALKRLWQGARDIRLRAGLAVALAVLLLWSGAASLLKATNDPSLSNYWMFSSRADEEAVRWADGHLYYRDIWLGIDGIRLNARAIASGMSDRAGNQGDAWTLGDTTRHLVFSAVDEQLGPRMRVPVPNVRAENKLYDNGATAVYHLRPRTPYQR